MFRKLVLIVSAIFIFSLVAFAQEKPKQEKMEKAEEKKTHEMIHQEGMVDDSEAVAVGPWNKLCPVMGNKVDPEVPTVEYDGKAYGFCCPGCDDKFRNDPEKYSKNLSEDGTKFIGKKSRH